MSEHPRAERPRIILDCDPGHDDAIAIVVAAHTCDLAGITTVAGNAPLDLTTHNALVMREMLGIEVPVHSGAARPLVAEPVAAGDVHGASGLDGSALPEPTRPSTPTMLWVSSSSRVAAIRACGSWPSVH